MTLNCLSVFINNQNAGSLFDEDKFKVWFMEMFLRIFCTVGRPRSFEITPFLGICCLRQPKLSCHKTDSSNARQFSFRILKPSGLLLELIQGYLCHWNLGPFQGVINNKACIDQKINYVLPIFLRAHHIKIKLMRREFRFS